jgi:hypothetical protein
VLNYGVTPRSSATQWALNARDGEKLKKSCVGRGDWVLPVASEIDGRLEERGEEQTNKLYCGIFLLEFLETQADSSSGHVI